ncbi:MAG: ParA family protein [bacterium]|nr:ParA family protein [bacterium]
MNSKEESRYAMPLRELATSMQWDEKELKQTLSLPSVYAPVPPKIVRELFRTRKQKNQYHFKTISFINLKGGVGKTVSAANTATRATQYGFKTCMIDMDMQASLTLLFNATPGDEDPIFFDAWQDPQKMTMPALNQIEDHLHILPSSLENGLLDSSLSKPASQKNAVKGVCNVLKENQFDLVVIDCPPSLGTAVISSICAADIIVIPLGNDSFSLKGLKLTLEEIQSICEAFGLPQPQVKILFTRYDKRQIMTRDIYRQVEKDYPQLLVPVVIRTSTDFSKAIARGETVFASSRKSCGKEDYDVFVKHILNIG